jgi:NAD-dependent deacetylase
MSGFDLRKVLVITGSGISADSGIPTFRGSGGYWRSVDATKLATPEGFRADPLFVWQWYSERREMIKAAQPNAAHIALAALERRAGEFLLVTQNVDDLHRRAGSSAEALVQVHGDIFVSRCEHCDFSRHDEGGHSASVPRCPQCGERLRPGVVWFGEMLAENQLARVEGFLRAGPCSLVLVIGTTAQFPYIVRWARQARGRTGVLVEVNPEAVLEGVADEVVKEGAAMALPRLFPHI